VLLLAVAVIDDLGAILVIALFYSSGIVLTGIVGMAVGIALILTLQALGVRGKLVYVVPGVVLWAGTYAAGIHPTIAGVIIGMLTPVTAWRGADGLLGDLSRELEALQANSARSLSSHDLAPHLSAIDVARREALSPAESLIETLHPWVAFAIMPIFALANAGVSLAGASMAGDGGLITLGAVLGLVLGKPLGILLFGGVAIASGLAALPTGLKGRHLLVLGVVAGIGFTMALFVADLAFTDAELLGAAKLGVLVASAAAALLGLLLGRFLLENATPAGAAATADEAEASTTE
jgi:NhaA family Na+:H+ antiporter